MSTQSRSTCIPNCAKDFHYLLPPYTIQIQYYSFDLLKQIRQDTVTQAHLETFSHCGWNSKQPIKACSEFAKGSVAQIWGLWEPVELSVAGKHAAQLKLIPKAMKVNTQASVQTVAHHDTADLKTAIGSSYRKMSERSLILSLFTFMTFQTSKRIIISNKNQNDKCRKKKIISST